MLHKDAICAGLLENHEYRKDALQYMMKMQRDLQIFMSNKRGSLGPNTPKSVEKLNEAWYYYGCLNTEFFETMERLENCDFNIEKISNEDLLEIQFEVVDMFHFLENMLIYTDRNVTCTLEELYDKALSNHLTRETKIINYRGASSEYKLENNISVIWKDFTYTWGEIQQNLPFKHWKSYTPVAFEYNDMLLDNLTYDLLIKFVEFCILLNIDHKMLFNLYISKNKENIARQNDTTKGYT